MADHYFTQSRESMVPIISTMKNSSHNVMHTTSCIPLIAVEAAIVVLLLAWMISELKN